MIAVVCIKDKNTEDFYNNILSKVAKFKNILISILFGLIQDKKERAKLK